MTVGRKPVHQDAIWAWNHYRPKEIGDLARHLGISSPAVSKWKQVPADRLDAVAAWLGTTPDDLRPDLYKVDPWAALE
jgi:DNA-binding transcriptional regulator YdaS (Cro superfamily)